VTLDVLIPAFVILVASLSFHEAAHAWTANRLGDPTARQLGRLTLNPLAHIDLIGTVLFPLVAMYSGFPLIGWAKPVPVNVHNLRSPRRDFAIVALAGPVSNLILAIPFALLLAVAMPDAEYRFANQGAAGIIYLAVLINVLLAVFNMIPVPPLDGGNVLAGFVSEPVARMIDAMRPWGFLLLYVLMFAGILDRFVRPVANAILELLL
jgi:Zn-dependent protease